MWGCQSVHVLRYACIKEPKACFLAFLRKFAGHQELRQSNLLVKHSPSFLTIFADAPGRLNIDALPQQRGN